VDDFFLLASDGLFDRFSSKECCKEITKKLRKMDLMEQSVQDVAQDLVNMAKSKRVMTDNITLILVALNRGIEAKQKPDKDKH
jgi:serine/threonine protein phosphatase PrpC